MSEKQNEYNGYPLIFMAGGTREWEGRVQNCPLLSRIIYRQITKTIPKLAHTGLHHAAHEPIVTDARKIQALKVWYTKSRRPPVVRLSLSIAYGKSGAPCEFRLLIKFSEKSVWGHKNVLLFEVASPKSHQWDQLSLPHMSLEPCLHTL